MSKKKVSRAVMTLKDFHGGSIPSDLPLPSAPGMAVERSSFERQGSGAWMSPVGRGGYGGNERNSMGQNRQGLGNAIRGFEDKASLFPNPANIGRNYDEDERKPVDGRPRSSHSAEQYEEHAYDERPRSGHHDKTFNRFSPDEHGFRGMAPAASGQSSQVNKPKPPVSPPPPNWRQPPQQPPPTAGFVDRNSGPNVWPARQVSEVNQMPAELVQNQSQVSVSWRTQTPKSKTLDLAMPDNKASPKSWQPEHSYGGESTGWQGHGHGSENPERSHFSRQQAMYPDKNINPRGYASGIAQMDGRVIYGESYGGRGAYKPVAERPKLKLLPRSKPLELNEALGCIGSEVPAIEVLTILSYIYDAIDASGFVVKGPPSNFESGDGGSKLVERPKLNLKPRSQPLEAQGATGGSDRSWDSVFGGARPRELVLRARGANDFGTAGENRIPSPPSPRIGQIPGSGNTKLEQQKGGRSDRSDSRGEEKQVGSQPYEHQGERFMERQGSGLREQQGSKQDWLAPSNHLGDKEWKGHRDSEKQDNKDRYEVNRPYDYQNSHSRGTDRQESTLRGAHKADGWRRPTSPIPVRSPAWTPSNSSTAPGGHHSFNAPASALELAKAFSRSSSIGSPMAGITQSNSGDQRHSVNLISRGQGYGPGSMKGNVTGYDQKDVSFSRLAESPPASSPIKRDVYAPGSGYGGNKSYNRFGGSKNGGGFGSAVGDMNSRLSYG
ncbi:unnamed protein product [Sphagnum jensenii]|uniref:Uncharacterized protein n=1 Tax=Sphagnum jensenii TaxID=128206 RepID=A0ABP1C3K6_9BRYO